MGVLEMLLGKDNPAAMWAQQNRGWTSALGAGLGSGATFQEGLANAAQMGPQGQRVDDAYRVSEEQKAERQRAINQTSEYLRSTFPDLAEAVNAGMPLDAAWNEAMKRSQPGYGQQDVAETPANIREWQVFNAMTPEEQSAYLRMKRANPYLDVGTGYVSPDPINPGGTVGAPIAKDNFTPAYDAAAGGAAAKVDVANEDAYESLKSKLPGLKTVIGELSGLAKTATYTQTGQLIDNAMRETGMEPGEAAVARTKYIAMVDNQVLPLLRDTFGAAFTVKEGETLRATLGDPNKSPAEKQVILEAFIEQKVRDLEALQSRVPSAASPAASGAPPTDYKTKYGLE